MLLEKGATINEPNGAGITPLAMAASGWNVTLDDDQVELCKHLLLNGAKIKKHIGSTGSTALQIAIMHGRAVPMDFDADPYAKNKTGDNALDIAIHSIQNSKTTVEVHATIMKELFVIPDSDVPPVNNICPFATAVQSLDIDTIRLYVEAWSKP